MTRRHIGLCFVPFLSRTASSFDAIMEIRRAAANLLRSPFMLDELNDFHLSGEYFSGNMKLGLIDDGTVVPASFGKGDLPASCTINVSVVNPNTGIGGTGQSAGIPPLMQFDLVRFFKEQELRQGQLQGTL